MCCNYSSDDMPAKRFKQPTKKLTCTVELQDIGNITRKVFQRKFVNETLCFRLRNKVFLRPKHFVLSTDTFIGRLKQKKKRFFLCPLFAYSYLWLSPKVLSLEKAKEKAFFPLPFARLFVPLTASKVLSFGKEKENCFFFLLFTHLFVPLHPLNLNISRNYDSNHLSRRICSLV